MYKKTKNKQPKTSRAYKERCVVVSLRHDFIKPWIRAYFYTGNTIPLVIIPNPPNTLHKGDLEYCKAAAEFSGGMILDCSEEWKRSEKLSKRAVRQNIGWYTKKSLLYAVATRLSPKSWAWIDDDAEITGNIEECFDFAESRPGFICTQFYHPDDIDPCHPAAYYRSNIDPKDKMCWNSFMFFHGDANKRISEELWKEFEVEDDEIVFCDLYKSNPAWHDGFCDFSIRKWQMNCKLISQIPQQWYGKLLHYTSCKNRGEVKKMWAAKADKLPPAPFEHAGAPKPVDNDNEPVDAVFVIGTGSVGDNEELRYALRNIERNCKFIRDVYICGFCPKWVDKTQVKHLQWPDRFSHAKDANIIDKLRHACEQPGIAKRILFCSDDQFQTRECRWEDFSPRYLRKYESSDKWYAARNRVWHARLRETMERDVQRRRAANLDASHVFYYQPHIWMPIDRDQFIAYAKWCNYEGRTDTIIASGYYNFIDADGKPDFDHTFIAANASEMPKTTHVAYHDGSYPFAIKLLREAFPEKSRFEAEWNPIKESSREVRRALPTDKVPDPWESTGPNENPASATPREMLAIHHVSARVLSCSAWNNLLGEISKAEELRMFGVRGWRTVWGDIISRWRSATNDGRELMPVASNKSAEATKVISEYGANPDKLRTVDYQHKSGIKAMQPPAMPVRRRPEPASRDVMRDIRERAAKAFANRTTRT